MSHYNGHVTFDDGQRLYIEYNGTSDVVKPELWDSPEEVEAHWRHDGWRRCSDPAGHPQEPVTIYVGNISGGFHWRGRACRACRAVTDGLRPYDDGDVTRTPGEP